MNKRRQTIVEFVKTDKPIDLSSFALLVVNKIKKEGMIVNDRRTKVHGTD